MKRLRPSIIVFDVDGVLIDPRQSFHRSVLDTVHHYTGRRFTAADLHHWKSLPGYNDDWRLTTDWLAKLGKPIPYEEVQGRFMKFYWGDGNGVRGNVNRERWLAPRALLRQLGRRYELAIHTGRMRSELEFSFVRFRAAGYFRHIVTCSDVARSKPYPDGLLKILAGREPASALFLGDSVDDAASARAAGVPFVGVLQDHVPHRRRFAQLLKEGGAMRVLRNIREVNQCLA